MTEAKHRIVIVDDDAGMMHAMERLLNAAGYQSVAFSSAEALLDTDATTTAECLVLDIHLPGLSGFDLGFHLRQTGYHAPIIFITAFDDPDSRRRAQANWAAGYFIKPFPGQALLAAIAKAIEAESGEKTQRR